MKSGNYINVLQKIYYISFGNLLRVVARAAGVESHTATTLKNENICVYVCVCSGSERFLPKLAKSCVICQLSFYIC